MWRVLSPNLVPTWLKQSSTFVVGVVSHSWPRDKCWGCWKTFQCAGYFLCSRPVFSLPPPPQILSTMARRPRSSRAWHFVLSAAHRDADARAMALAGTANWSYDSDGQVSGYYWNKVRRPPRRAFPWSSRTLLLTLGSPWLRIHMALRRQDLQTDTTLLFIYLFIYYPPHHHHHITLYTLH